VDTADRPHDPPRPAAPLRPSRLTIRFRLGRALAVALLPVLVLGVLQSVAAFRRDAQERRESLLLGAELATTLARARLESATVLLEALGPDALGVACGPRLRAVRDRLPGYENLIRFTASGRVACAADSVPAEAGRGDAAWFQRLRAGGRSAVVANPAGALDDQPALVSAVRAEDEDGAFDGALVAVIRLETLRPDLARDSLPPGTAVAITDSAGRPLSVTDPAAFERAPRNWTRTALARGSTLYQTGDQRGRRVFAAAPLVGDDVFVLLSAPQPSVFSWARLDPYANIVLPVLAWLAAFFAVWLAGERVVGRWLSYLNRIAGLYAKGRFSVRPVKARDAPPEISALAQTLDEMAGAIVHRDHTLRDNLAQKDALMREIHHRVKNNLQIITSLLNMQQRAMTDDTAKAALSDTRQRITALALIYRQLYQGSDLRLVEVRPFLEELLAQLLTGGGPRTHPVRTEVVSDEMGLDPDKIAPFALFLVEAVTNALKHAFPERGGHISVRFTRGEHEARLEIRDDGVGTTPEAAARGVGSTLMTAFARQLRGRAEIERSGESGTTARLIFPIPGPHHEGEAGAAAAALSPRPAAIPEGSQAAA
jgi:two-component sensor histidine kinase